MSATWLGLCVAGVLLVTGGGGDGGEEVKSDPVRTSQPLDLPSLLLLPLLLLSRAAAGHHCGLGLLL